MLGHVRHDALCVLEEHGVTQLIDLIVADGLDLHGRLDIDDIGA